MDAQKKTVRSTTTKRVPNRPVRPPAAKPPAPVPGEPLPLGSEFYQRRFFIEDVRPVIDGGRFAVKRIVNEAVEVSADIFRDGHDVTVAVLCWRRENEKSWLTSPMVHLENDRWRGEFTPHDVGRYEYAIEAWTSGFMTWRHATLLKLNAGVDIAVELMEGKALVEEALQRTRDNAQRLEGALKAFETTGEAEALLADDLVAPMRAAEHRPDLTMSKVYPLRAERLRARAGAWYELFPRSQTNDPNRHGTFDDVIMRVPAIAALGYDVLYFPPIHPIGKVNRKGKNNSLVTQPGEPGSPYAIGSSEGGHDAIHPELGTLEDFRRLINVAKHHGMEIALDFATQCSPDHPWLKEHHDWFKWRPDGSMRFAENPPKKYEDIVNPDFYCADRVNLWRAFRDVIQFWGEQGVRIIRVDNPHTKPFLFWEWMIREVQTRFPDMIFLSEAFTRPKVMKALAKLGFTQSYTYFTWRTSKADFEAYLRELTGYPEREYYRPNFFVNTPDILPYHLQSGETWMFKSRVALAATLAASYGVYSGFELIEHVPLAPGKEEYLDSEKYEIRPRDWNAPGNINDYIGRLNAFRHANSALQQNANLRFCMIDNDAVLGFVKESFAHDNAVAVAIALGRGPYEFWFHFGDLQIGPEGAKRHVRAVENLVTGERRTLEWGGIRLWIDPSNEPALLFRCIT